ncbi:hypothetical protein G3N55_07685 [Dissulfurirhabdus thermomarina]|uniref:Type 4 fimbrial biogenesis protein PilX N-terminal domain-containing protein n=1 Tax=Dissulfurirhabdus thermomarina TaxID=1765737 RepID=A0A6N9TQJ0_DISTH|nr:pilus assembly PilX N-terminal domain-containing protein [Dissulfurirhabdus thermomarina]NDY42720.1 hypothetical protein [Dissulfurirhabdus thermomarina]NMX23632.1 hypothetical protein [Dissulfurirhabdus thermomarina]
MTDERPLREDARPGESGIALVISLVVLAALMVVAIGLSQMVSIDIGISGNIYQYAQALNRAESGLGMAEEGVAYSIDNMGAEGDGNGTVTVPMTLGGTAYTLGMKVVPGTSLYGDGGNVTISSADGSARAVVDFLNVDWAQGASIQMAAGYEGVGKSAAAGGANRWYAIESTGVNARGSGGRAVVEEVYRYVLGSGGF